MPKTSPDVNITGTKYAKVIFTPGSQESLQLFGSETFTKMLWEANFGLLTMVQVC